MKFAKKAPCICLTATCSDLRTKGIERLVLNKMEFRIFEDLFDEPELKATVPTFKQIKGLSHEQVCKLIE